MCEDYFDEHQQELEATYNKSVLPLPQVQAAFDGGDAVASEEWWKRRMRAFVDRRVGGDGEYEGARVQDLYGEIDGELGVEKSDTPCLWDCGHMNLLPESNESLVIGSSVWSRGSEEVESKLSIDSCGKEETMPRLRKLNVECNAVIPSDLWQEMVCAERVALFGRLTGQRDASSLETFYQLQTPFLTRCTQGCFLYTCSLVHELTACSEFAGHIERKKLTGWVFGTKHSRMIRSYCQ